MKRLFFVMMVLVVLVGVANTAPIRYFLSYVIDFKHYRYSNASGSFTFTDMNARDASLARIKFERFLETSNPQSDDSVLYRLFYRNPLAFWRYWDYRNDKYDLPYKNPKTIKRAKKN